MTIGETFITILPFLITAIISGCIGYLLKREEYRRKKIALRDEKLLNRKINAYNNILSTNSKINSLINQYLKCIDDKDTYKLIEIINEISELVDKIYEEIFAMGLYIEEEIALAYRQILNMEQELAYTLLPEYILYKEKKIQLFSKEYESLMKQKDINNDDFHIEYNKEKIKSIHGEWINLNGLLRKTMRKDLGFKK